MLRRQLTVITRLSTSAHRTHTVSHTLSHPVPLSTALPSRIPLLAVSAPIATSITQQTHQIDTTAEQLQAPVYPDSLSPLLTWLHNSLASLHDATGLPWWATIVLTACAAKLALFPIAVIAQKNAQRMVLLSPYLTSIRKHIMALPSTITRSIALPPALFKAFDLAQFSPAALVALPVLQISAWLCFVTAWRTLLATSTGMSTEGIELLGLQNLQLKDSSGILALTAVSSIVVNFEYMRHKLPAAAKQSGTAKLFSSFSALSVLTVPLLTEAPVGVFMYIIPSALLSILQNYLLHQPNFRKRFGLFVAPTPANPNPTSSKPSL